MFTSSLSPPHGRSVVCELEPVGIAKHYTHRRHSLIQLADDRFQVRRLPPLRHVDQGRINPLLSLDTFAPSWNTAHRPTARDRSSSPSNQSEVHSRSRFESRSD